MSVPLTINGVTFQYPQEFDTHWGPTLTNWSTAVTNALVPIAGGVLTLTPYPNSGVSFANATNTGFLSLTVNGSNQLTFNGVPIGATATLTDNHIFVGNVTNNPADVAMSGDVGIVASGLTTIQAGAIVDSKISASAAIALSKLAPLTASQLVVTNGSGVLTTLAAPTLTEIGYVAGVTSAIQTQLNSITSGFLPLSGGTMSGVINMGANKITGLANGSNPQDAAAFGQLFYGQQAALQTTTTASITNNTTSFVASNLSLSITPTSSTKRVKITAFATCQVPAGGEFIVITLFRGASNLAGANGMIRINNVNASGTLVTGWSLSYIDSPATTSTVGYNIEFKSGTGGIVAIPSSSGEQGAIILEEIV